MAGLRAVGRSRASRRSSTGWPLLSPAGDRLGLERIARAARPARPSAGPAAAGASTSPAPTARARPAPSCAPRSRQRARSVHVFTSPHLVRFNERIRIAGKLIDDDALAALLAEVLDASDGIEPSFFEVDHRRRLPRLRARRRPTPASSKSGSAAGSTRPTSIDRPLVMRHRQPRPRPPAVPRRRAGRDRRRESRHRQARRAAGHPALPAGDRRAGSARSPRMPARAGCRAAALGRDRPPGQAALSRRAGRARPAAAPPARPRTRR